MSSPETQLPHLVCKSRGPRGFVGSGQSWVETLGSCLWSQHGGQTPFSWPFPTCPTPARAGGRQQAPSPSLWGSAHRMLPSPHGCQDPAGRRVLPQRRAVSSGVLREEVRGGVALGPAAPHVGQSLRFPSCRSRAACDSGRHILTCPRATPALVHPRSGTLPALSSNTNHSATERRLHTQVALRRQAPISVFAATLPGHL